MSLLVRKIDKGKWLQTDIASGEDVSADAITNRMKTSGNALSVWEIESETSIEEAILAIVSQHEHLESIDVVVMNSGYLKENGIDVANRLGRTPVGDLQETHRNLSDLSYSKLGVIAYHIVEQLNQNNSKRYTEGQIKRILRTAIEQSRLGVDDLSEFVKKKLSR